MINIGSCNLHIVHGAFKSGFESTDWEMKKVLKGCYQILHDSPARRADYITITKSNKFPLAFCSTRWIEDRHVADRLLEIWPEIVKVVNYWNSLPKSKQPKCKTFITLVNAVNDLLTPLKLSFFSYFASMLHPFLVKYQSEKPLIPYLYDDLTKCVKNILRVIVKEETLDCLEKDLSKINPSKSCNLKSRKDYHLGLATEAMLKELRKKMRSKGAILNIFTKWLLFVLKKLQQNFSKEAPLILLWSVQQGFLTLLSLLQRIRVLF